MQKILIIFVVTVAIVFLFVEKVGNNDNHIQIGEQDQNVNNDRVVDDNEQKSETVPVMYTLDLSGEQLAQAPSYIFERTDLVSLDLSNNDLHGSLQAEVRFLKNLKVLDLSHNHLTGVPAEVGQLSQLEVLDLSHNQLTGLPHELGNLKNLKTLDLTGNNPSTFDLKIIREALPGTTIILE